jgi:hypothetical protein
VHIVGITGFKGTGKTTAAEHLVRTYGFRRVRFAAPLKAMLKAFGLSEAEVDGYLKEEPCALLNGTTPRLAMQTLGTEWGRMMIHPNLWIDSWKREVIKLSQQTPDVSIVCDDCRFANEFDAIRSLGGKVLRITRPGREGGQHPSEADMAELDADYSFVNNGNQNALYAKLEQGLRVALDARVERV